MSEAFKCVDCHMTFGTVGLLQKHKRKFCVGGSIGDPDNLLLRKGLYSADSPKQRPLSPDDRDYPHYNPNQEAQLRQLAENHGRQMEYLQIKNRDLEKQREDIRRRLEQLGKKGPNTDNSADLLAELRAQEERNQRALNDLRRQLFEMGHKRVNVIEVEKPMNYPQPIIQQAPPPPPPQESGRKSYIYPVYYGSSLVAEISAVRQAYLQNGGNDPDVLAQMSQMQAEAQRIEDEMKNANYDNKHREKKTDVSGKMSMIEMENERLHKELMLLQEQNFLSQNKRKSDREGRDYKYKGKVHFHKGHSYSRDHTYLKHLHKNQFDKLEYADSPRKHSYQEQMLKDGYSEEQKNFVKTYNDKLNHRHHNAGKNSLGKTVVPPLDLSSITGQKPKINVLPKIQSDEMNDNYFNMAANYTFYTKKKDKYAHQHQQDNRHDNQNFPWKKMSMLPNRNLPKIDEYQNLSGRKRNVGRSQSLYIPRIKINSGSHKGSIRSEIIGGVNDSDIYPPKNQMRKGSVADGDLVGMIRSKHSDHGQQKVSSHHLGHKKNSDMNYETVTIKQREELNPENNHVIHTTTYKEEKLNGIVT